MSFAIAFVISKFKLPSVCGFDVSNTMFSVLNDAKSILISFCSAFVSLSIVLKSVPSLDWISILPSAPNTLSNSCFDIFNSLL